MARRPRRPIQTTRSDHVAAEAYKRKGQADFAMKPEMEGGSIQDFLILLYGIVKIGKSTFASHFDDVYFLRTEPGLRSLKVRDTKITCWADFQEFVRRMEDKPRELATVKTFCVDTITNLSKFCMHWVCGREGIAHPSDQDWGKGWEAYADEFGHWILRLVELGKGVIFIAHESQIEVISRRQKISKCVPDMPRTTYRIINNFVDIILWMNYVSQSQQLEELGEMRCLYTKPNETRDAGDRTGKLPNVIKFRTEKQAVRKINRCFKD